MKHFILTLALICLGSMSALAQSTRVVKGAVVDKNGNPLPGAVVEATGGAESAVVDADGTYAIEVPIWLNSLTAKYAGMQTKKIKLDHDGDIIFRLRTQIADKGWFVNVVGAASFFDADETSGGPAASGPAGRLGLMGGYIGNWGGYVKVTPTFGDEAKACGLPAATIGVIKRIVGPAHIYVGLGYAPVSGDDDDYGYNGWHYDDCSFYENGMMVDFGFMFKFNHIVANVGYSYSNSFCCNVNHDLHFGVGYCF